MPKLLNRAIRIAPETYKVNATVVNVIQLDESNNIIFCKGTTVPSAGDVGYATGCEFIKTNGTASAICWVNEGTPSSASFVSAVTGSNQLLTANVPLSSAQILALNATPITLVAAPGANNLIVVENIEFKMVATATQYASGGAVTFQYHVGTVALANTIAAAVVNAAAGTTYTVREGIDVTGAINSAVEITNATGAFTTGTGTAVVIVKYRIITP